MSIRTKVVSTIIAMVCSLSVSATGIVAILLQFPVQVANTTSIALGDVQGDLYGERYGAGDTDLVLQHLYKNGVGVDTDTMNYFCRDVSFSADSRKIEYIFKFVLSGSAENGVLVALTDATLSNSVNYTATYQYAYGQPEPDWSTAEICEYNKNMSVTQQTPYIWLKATLVVNQNVVQRVDLFDYSATWGFAFTFTGVQVSTD